MHVIFWGLQDHLKEVLQSLPDSISPHLRNGVVAAHEKLSEYYYKYDESPLYTWAAFLDPHISYEEMHDDYTGDHLLANYLKDAKRDLYNYYNTLCWSSSPQKVDFTSRYWKKTVVVDELTAYFNLP
ncbi:uncharacterized protein EV420DRAFT_1651060 [Desarmillaria tabescens]|uniref:Uncharacterized protein n=1 Tax=Armillaria tabescens TaxID=1929756 RepID=A0AA39MME6_ARMTA|nr:uncharacterized protein EV420DRAFT_1651060 [Desarmillaria tabescens]KAK0439278.1 hypothetical protein EV420DRAFT_1651060 [Desarmillaria tabescens]